MKFSIVGLFIIASLIGLYIGKIFFLPLCVAVLISFLFRPIVKHLSYLHIPEQLSALLIISLITGGVILAISGLASPARQWIEEAPGSLRQLQIRLDEWTQPVKEAQKATEQMEKLGNIGNKKNGEVVLAKKSLDSQIVSTTQQTAIGLVTVLILLFFILGWGERFYRNLVNSLPQFSSQKKIVLITKDIEDAVSKYLLTITVINILLGAVVAGALYVLGMPNPILWGVLTAFLNYIPYIGPAITAAILTFVALLTFSSIGQIVTVPMVFIAITSIEGYILTPMAVGRRLSLNPLIIFLSLLFWYMLWGFLGALLTVPALVCIKVAMQRIERLRPYAVILD